MNEEGGQPATGNGLRRRSSINLAALALLAAGLGLLMEGLLVVGGQTSATLSSLAGNGLWPFLVCLAVGVGQTLSEGSPPGAGALAALCTPVAFLLAQVLQRALSELMDHAGQGSYITGALLLEAALRATEYAVLAAGLAWLGKRRTQPLGSLLAYLGLGLVLGVGFGLVIAALLPPDSLLGWIVEEVLFPTGCAATVFVSEALAATL